MGRKTKKQQAIDLLLTLTQKDLTEVLGIFAIPSIDNSYEKAENILRKECPYCHSNKYIRKGKNNIGLTQFKCKNCNKKYNILSKTPLEKTQYSWDVWVTVLEQMLKRQSIKNIQAHLITNKIVPDIAEETVSAMEHKLRNSFINFPLPTLEGVVQCDEKHFRENQKGTKNPIDVLNISNKTFRRGYKRSTPSKYGTMGPEFSTICCAVDSSGHSIAKVVRMGYMSLEDFEDNIANHFGNIRFLCSDMNTVYTQYASIHKIPQYVCN
ncbi:MAG: IS1 family transposase, partial [Clostridia bacterium]|nr:IS1 family transposase [Clostridia bacterium]